MKNIIIFLIVSMQMATFVSCQTKKEQTLKTESGNHSKADQDMGYFVNKFGDTIQKINISDEEWKKMLSPAEYHVMREKGTERPHSGDLLGVKDLGIYTCRGCGMPLFESDTKFESSCGWPSYFKVIDSTHIVTNTDYDIGYARTELTCAKCGSHLGHVFDDGPPPTGLRYCINSVSLDFIKKEQ